MVMVSWVQWSSAHLEHGLMRGRFPLHMVARHTADPRLYREAGDASKAKPYLPDMQKQYLITRNGAWKQPVCVTGDVPPILGNGAMIPSVTANTDWTATDRRQPACCSAVPPAGGRGHGRGCCAREAGGGGRGGAVGGGPRPRR